MRAPQRDARTLTAGQSVDDAVSLGLEPDGLDHFADSLRRLIEDSAEVAEVLLHRQIDVDRRCLGHVADPTAQRRASRLEAETRTEPASITCTPTIDLISVDFPLPLGPSSPVTAPARTVADRSSSALRPPRTTCNRSQRTASSTDTGAF